MAQLNDTEVNGNLAVSGQIQVNGEDIDDKFDELYSNIQTVSEIKVSHRRLLGEYTDETVYGVCGHITSSGVDAHLYIPMNWAANVSNVSVSSIVCAIRHVGGGYLGGSMDIDLTSYIFSVNASKAQGLLRVVLKNSSGWGITNNTPLSGTCTISYTVS